jgi:hypothetical protein
MNNNELTNQSGIIKVEITKGDKVAHASIYVDHYLRLLKNHKGMGDTMIQSVLDELDIIQSNTES